MEYDYDLIVIGGGSAGYNGASLAAKLGLRTAVVDGSQELGGLCILRGCMPSKTLIESANRFLSIRRAKEFGLHVENASPDPAAIQTRKRNYVSDFAEYRRGQLEDGRFRLIRGYAEFIDNHTISVTELNGADSTNGRLTARAFLLATGSVIQPVGIPGLPSIGYLDSDAALEDTSLPESLIVLGGGAIAMEMAHYYSALGTKVTIIQRSSQVLREEDKDVADALVDAMRARGVTVYTGTKLIRAEPDRRNKRIHFHHGTEETSVAAQEVLFALGRMANTDALQLDSIGVKTERGRVITSSAMQSSVPNIFAAGDAAGPYEVVHIAIQQAETAVRNIHRMTQGNAAMEDVDYRLKLFVVFSHPEVARIGATEKELIQKETPYRMAKYHFADHGKSLIAGEPEGFVKLLAAKDTGEILGGAVVGLNAPELIHEIAVAMHFRATAADLLRVPHYHPTVSEIWTYPAEELAEVSS